MKYFVTLFFFMSSQSFASEVFKINYLPKTSKAEEFRLLTKEGRKFELTKKSGKKEGRAELPFETGKRLTELVTKLAFSEKSHTKCSVYFTFQMDGEQGRICQEERERTRDAIQLMHHLYTFF